MKEGDRVIWVFRLGHAEGIFIQDVVTEKGNFKKIELVTGEFRGIRYIRTDEIFPYSESLVKKLNDREIKF